MQTKDFNSVINSNKGDDIIVEMINDDIGDKEWYEVHEPYENNLNEFLVKYVVTEVFSFQLANSYYRGCLCKASMIQHFNSMTDCVLVSRKCIDEVIPLTIELLKIKYNLKVISANPVVLEKWQ